LAAAQQHFIRGHSVGWRIVKLAGPFPFPFVFRCEDGITRWLLPPGNASECASIGPRSRARSSLYSGVGKFYRPVGTYNPHHLFEQEAYVYRIEMQSAVRRAVEQLFKVNPLPRSPGHAATDTTPFPEDFVPMMDIPRPKRGRLGTRKKTLSCPKVSKGREAA
jgi:hypothetical protein